MSETLPLFQIWTNDEGVVEAEEYVRTAKAIQDERDLFKKTLEEIDMAYDMGITNFKEHTKLIVTKALKREEQEGQ
jgi:hypothetical protein